MATRFASKLHCLECHHKWRVITHYQPQLDDPVPPCPKCGAFAGPIIGMDPTSGVAPAAIGGNISIKAIDETQRIVTEDYGLTDIRSDVRQGETAAPKLPPKQQQMADGYFGGGGSRRRQIGGFNPAAAAAAAMAGRLSDPVSTARSIGATHANRVRPPVHLLNSRG